MDIKVLASPFKKTLRVPSSKSYTNRLLVLASLFEGDFVLENFTHCDDVDYLCHALKKVGLNLIEEETKLTIKDRFPDCENHLTDELVLHTGNGGTTTRFLIAFLTRGKRPYRLILGSQISNRPLSPLISKLRILGAKIEWDKNDLLIQGPVDHLPSCLSVETDKTTQFASSLLLAFSPEKMNIEYDKNSPAKKYLELTEKMISEVRSGKRHFVLSPDFSSLAFPAALAAVTGEVTLSNCLRIDESQADSVLLEVLTRMNVLWKWTESGLFIQKSEKLHAFNQDCQNCQDLVPVLCYLASFAEGESVLRNLSQLRFKETDRIKSCTDILDLFSISWHFDDKNSSLFIRGGKSITPFLRWKSLPDHRIIMMVYLFMRSHSGGEILGASEVSKSYPDFFEEINS